MTHKFLVYDLIEGSFLNEAFMPAKSNNIEQAAIFSDLSIPFNDTSRSRYLQIPLTQGFIDTLPFTLKDCDPEIPISDAHNNIKALIGDFIILTNFGFYDEVYNSLTNSSRPHIQSFDLHQATLYNMEQLKTYGIEYITKANDYMTTIIVPISKAQQAMLQRLPDFSSEHEPYGFFMTPLGPSQLDFDYVE